MSKDIISLRTIKGVGPKYLEIFEANGLYTVNDLLLRFPSKYDFYEPEDLRSIKDYAHACLVGTVISPPLRSVFKKNLSMTSFNIDVSGQVIHVIFFNRVYIGFSLKAGHQVKVYGKYNIFKKEFIAANVFPDLSENHIDLSYKLEGIPDKTIQKIVLYGIDEGLKAEEYLPKVLLDSHHLLNINEMIKVLHNPKDSNDVKVAQERFKYEEILNFFIKLEYYQSKKKKISRTPIVYNKDLLREVAKTLPFELTADQKTTINEICKSFLSPVPMNRLVQGDVGSGKTIVALMAALACASARFQTVMMAPTEILAEQHFEYFKNILAPFGIRIALYTGSTPKGVRGQIKKDIKAGLIDILIGTHALYYDKMEYFNLGLAIIDEQQRFGVSARNSLLDQKEGIDALYLTATPIPRTLALSLFSDLEISTIKTTRPTKKPVQTKILSLVNVSSVLKHLKEEIKRGHQAYFVVSAIESDDEARIDIKDVVALLEMQCPGVRIGELNGRMKDSEKNQVMAKFKAKEYDVLVSTTVIEVGISVDNATMMVVMDAQNFGLSQLHQLRGRIGRGDLEGYCYLLSNDVDIERLKTLERTNDGFILAEDDLKFRGPGDYFGMRQSGLPSFVYADFTKDLSDFRRIHSEAKRLQEVREIYPDVEKYLSKIISNLEIKENLN